MPSRIITAFQEVGSAVNNFAVALPNISEITMENLSEVFRKLPYSLRSVIDDRLELAAFDLGAQLKKLAGRASDRWSVAEWQAFVEKIAANPRHQLHDQLKRVMSLNQAMWDNDYAELLEEFCGDISQFNWHVASSVRRELLADLEQELRGLDALERALYDAFVEKFLA